MYHLPSKLCGNTTKSMKLECVVEHSGIRSCSEKLHYLF